MAQRTCGYHVCGKAFETAREDQRYCSRRCKERAHDFRRLAKMRTNTCPVCAFTFDRPRYRQRPQCPECRRRKQEARQAGRFDLRDGLLGEDIGIRAASAYMVTVRCDPCAYCGEAGAQVDHITPRSSDGPNHWTNYTSACRSCNLSKRNLPVLNHLLSQRILRTLRQDAYDLGVLIGPRRVGRMRDPHEIAALADRHMA